MSKKLVIIPILLILAAAVFLIGFARRPTVLAHGCFHQVAHKGSGCATLLRLSDGKTVLQLTDFATAENSDLRVLLISAPDAPENSAVLSSERVDLGPLRVSEPEQEYSIPRSVNIDTFHAVTVWNARYQVNFTTAPLKRQ